MILTYRYRLKTTSGAAQELSRQARAVNLVWNFCGETQETARRWNTLWPSGFDLINLTHGSSRQLGLHSDTVQAVCKQFAHSRDTRRRRPKWRGRRSLGWIPFQAVPAIRREGDGVIFLKRRYRLWLSRPVEGTIKSGSFAQDAWRCTECGVQHDRHINSAINILVSGRNAGLQLTEIPAL